MKHYLLLLFSFVIVPLMATNVTFKVDMNAQSNFNASVDSLTITGSLNDWNAKANVLTDDNDDGIYEASIMLKVGDVVEYKYVIVDGDGDEDVWGDAQGAAAYAGTSNRALRVPEADLVLETVSFTGCTGINSGMVSVIFQVDMSNETVAADGVYVVGEFPGKAWWTNGFAFNESTNSVYLDTINLVPDFKLNYKYLNGGENWDGQETTIPADVKYGDNRGGVIPNMVNQYYTLPVTPFNGKPTLYDVTFAIGSDNGELDKISINVFNRTLEVMEGGDTTIALADGYYPYTVNATSYYETTGDFMVDGAVKTINETLVSATKSMTFSIADSINVAPNTSLKITSSHPLKNADGSEITNDNVSSVVSMMMGTSAVDFFAMINDGKNEITLVPNVLLTSNTLYQYGIKPDAMKYDDDELVSDSMVSFTVKTYEAALDTYFDFDGTNHTTGFYTKVADDHVGASAQPFYTAAPASASNKALKFSKGTGSWGGWGKLQIDLESPIDLSTGKIIAFDVYSTKAVKVRVALTDTNNTEAGVQVETGDMLPADVYVSKVNEWQTLYVDFSEGDFNAESDYSHILFCFDAGVDEDNTYYIDNLRGPSFQKATVIQSVKSNDKLLVYPNPAKSFITISSGENIENLSIYSISGQLVHQASAINVKEVIIDTKDFSNGMYIVQTRGEKLNATSTIIIK